MHRRRPKLLKQHNFNNEHMQIFAAALRGFTQYNCIVVPDVWVPRKQFLVAFHLWMTKKSPPQPDSTSNEQRRWSDVLSPITGKTRSRIPFKVMERILSNEYAIEFTRVSPEDTKRHPLATVKQVQGDKPLLKAKKQRTVFQTLLKGIDLLNSTGYPYTIGDVNVATAAKIVGFVASGRRWNHAVECRLGCVCIKHKDRLIECFKTFFPTSTCDHQSDQNLNQSGQNLSVQDQDESQAGASPCCYPYGVRGQMSQERDSNSDGEFDGIDFAAAFNEDIETTPLPTRHSCPEGNSQIPEDNDEHHTATSISEVGEGDCPEVFRSFPSIGYLSPS